MTRHHGLDVRLALYGDLSGILNAMRSFALAELRRVTRRQAVQQAADKALAQSMADISPALQQAPSSSDGDIRVVLGSVRGFCGSFNDDIAQYWRQRQGPIAATIVVGERLAALLPESPNLIRIPGAVSTSDATETIERIIDAIDDVHKRIPLPQGLVICFREEQRVVELRLLPLSVPLRKVTGTWPMTYEPMPKVAAGVAQHYVFHRLLSALLRALWVENHMRLLQMENALQHIERNRDDLLRRRNQLRQEEIVEEIELILQRSIPPTIQ